MGGGFPELGIERDRFGVAVNGSDNHHVHGFLPFCECSLPFFHRKSPDCRWFRHKESPLALHDEGVVLAQVVAVECLQIWKKCLSGANFTTLMVTTFSTGSGPYRLCSWYTVLAGRKSCVHLSYGHNHRPASKNRREGSYGLSGPVHSSETPDWPTDNLARCQSWCARPVQFTRLENPTQHLHPCLHPLDASRSPVLCGRPLAEPESVVYVITGARAVRGAAFGDLPRIRQNHLFSTDDVSLPPTPRTYVGAQGLVSFRWAEHRAIPGR